MIDSLLEVDQSETGEEEPPNVEEEPANVEEEPTNVEEETKTPDPVEPEVFVGQSLYFGSIRTDLKGCLSP